MSGTIAFTYARMNPPTIGHELLVGCLKKMWWAHDKWLFLSPSQDNPKNPLSFDYKYELCKRAFSDVDVLVSKYPCKDFFDAMKRAAEHEYSEVDVVVGSDRFDELKYRLPLYNDKLYSFRAIRVHKLNRTNSDDAHGMSSTILREAAKLNDYETFENGLPTKLRSISREIFEEVKRGCLSESLVS